MDFVFFNKLANIIKEKTIFASVNYTFTKKDLFVISLYKEKRMDLLFSLDPELLLLKNKEDKEGEINNFFTNISNDWLKGAILKDIEIKNDDKVVFFHFIQTKKEIKRKVYLIVEFIGRYKNLYLTKDDFSIIANFIPNKKKNLSKKYQLPKKLKYNNILMENPNKLSSNLFNHGINKVLKKRIEELKEKEKNINDIVTSIKNESNLYVLENEFHFLKSNSKQEKKEPLTFLNEYLNEQRKNKKRNDLKFFLENKKSKKIKAAKKKIENINKKLEETKNYKKYFKQGDILISSLSNKQLLEDEEIKLDESLTINENAQKYFKKAKKLKKSIPHLAEQLKETKHFLSYLENIDINNKETISDLAILKEEFLEKGIIKKEKKQFKKSESIKISRKKLDEDTYILIGKSSTKNDYITFKLANKDEYFLHVANYPGAHVILQNANPSKELILKAAKEAAKNSKVKKANKVEIHYCKVKDVRKFKGANPGQVIIKNYKSIFINLSK